MADTIENLEIIIDVIADAEQELERLAADLLELQTIAETTDDVNIDVDVRGDRELDALMAQLAAIEAMDRAGVGNVSAGVRDTSAVRAAVAPGGAGGMGISQLLSAQVDQMGRLIRDLNVDLDEMGDSMAHTMSAADRAADSFNIADLSMSDLHNTMAQLVPVLIVFVGALPAVIAGVVALGTAAFAAAASLAAIAGLGFLGAAMARGEGNFMEGAQDILSEIQSDFMDAFGGLSQRLAPLFEDFLDGLDRMFQRIANLDDVLMSLTAEARKFGDFMSEWMVGLIRDLGLMADAFAPVFGMIADFAEDMDLIEALTVFMADALPDLVVLNRLLIGMLTRLTEMSKGFLEVANAVGLTLNAFFTLFEMLGVSNKQMGILIGTLLVGVTVANLLSSALVASLIPAIIRAGQYFAYLTAAAIANNASLWSIIYTEIVARTTTLSLSASLWTLFGSLVVVTGGTYLLVAAVGALASGFTSLGADVDTATESLANFQAQQNSMGSGTNPYADPNLQHGEGVGRSRFAGSASVEMYVDGNADEGTMRNAANKTLYKLERKQRRR